MVHVPYKSVAAALILVVLLGPIGLFYSSFLGGIIMSIFGLVAIGTMASMHSPLPMATVYLFCVIWAMAAVRFYSRKMLKIAVSGGFPDSDDATNNKDKKAKGFFRKKTDQAKSEASAEAMAEEINTEDNASWKL